MLRKVFGRDREDPATPSVPPQSREPEPTREPTPAAPEPTTATASAAAPEPAPATAAQKAAADLVAAAFDNPQIPKARTSTQPEAAEPTAVATVATAVPEAEVETAQADAQADAAEPTAEAATTAEVEVEAAQADAQAEAEEPAAEAEAAAPKTTDAEPPAAETEVTAPEKDADAAEPTAEVEAEPAPEAAPADATDVDASQPTAEAAPEAQRTAETDTAPEATTDADASEPDTAPATVPAPEAEAEAETAPADAETTETAPATADATSGADEPQAEAEPAAEADTDTDTDTDPAEPQAATGVRGDGLAPHLAEPYRVAGDVLRAQGLGAARARVYLVVDRSGSMRGYFKDGSVQRLAEQAVALAAHLDEDATVTTVFFSTDVDGVVDLTPADLTPTRVEEINAGLGRLGRTNYHRAVEEVLAHHEKADKAAPALVIFQTDGPPESRTAANQALAEAAGRPIHWRFTAWGEEDGKGFDYLRKLAADRTATHFAGPAPVETPHEDFYRGILTGLTL
ncbi:MULTISPECIES: VWA domain-containing protein [Streptomyces]|uniref:VWA domain-containing protein n=2 Tax=Streptomyces TaxID=1883 RepID=A0ABU4K4X8_9ACTN|nr:VWA domain-containing protein [Streptomyces roseolus]MDX2292806.1 VWA domain-containing protein [Streptomyces roseolus]